MDMSMAILWKSHWQHCTMAISIRCAQTKSAQLRPCLKPPWEASGKVFTSSCMRWSTTWQTFLVHFRCTMGHRLDRGPSGFLGFCSVINAPLPRESNALCCSNIMLVMLVRGVEITLGAYFNNLSLMLSVPGTCPLLRHPSACATSDWVDVDCQWRDPVVHQIDHKTALQTIYE